MQQQTQLETTEQDSSSFPTSSFSASNSAEENSNGFDEVTTRALSRLATSTLTEASTLAHVKRYYKQATLRYFCNLMIGLLVMSSFLILETVLPVAGRSSILPLVIGATFACTLLMYAITWSQMRAVEKTIATIEDIQMIGPLAEAWDAERFLKPKSVIAALRRLLPRLQASDSDLLTRQQRTCLYNAINWKAGRAVYQYDRQLTIAILKALQQIGDKEALPHVRRAALSMHKDVRDAANDCLKFLVEQAEQHKQGAQLLRPADARTSGPDVLLRASTDMTAQQQTPPEQLLRAHNQE